MDVMFHHSISQKERIVRVILLFVWPTIPVLIFYYLFVVVENITIFNLIASLFVYLLSILYLLKTLRFDVVRIKNGVLIQDSDYVGLFYRTEINLKEVGHIAFDKGMYSTSLIFFGKTIEKVNISNWRQEEIEYLKNSLTKDFKLNFK